ncbi:MAG: hypothetical protein KIT84_20270 [Labilithrix sp.]|nr:hypothetical protein [Labilithrix sp.]MCW5813376.1 hypothetical protein [Labilithrix sp.]
MSVPAFIKGPIPWAGWMHVACSVRGSAAIVALHVWLWAGIKRRRTVAINLARLPIGRASARRGLKTLEELGLVTVQRRPGRRAVITIVMRREP